jgi:hypothetical protein
MHFRRFHFLSFLVFVVLLFGVAFRVLVIEGLGTWV